jgi:hypothetical protein
MAKASIWAQWIGVAVGVLLSSSFARFLGLVYRVVALSPVVAAAEGTARASSAGWVSSAGVRRLGSVYSAWAAISSLVNSMTRLDVAKLDLLPSGMSG